MRLLIIDKLSTDKLFPGNWKQLFIFVGKGGKAMKCCRVQVYIAGYPDGSDINHIHIGMAYNPPLEARELAKKGYEWILPLGSSMGLYQAYRLVQEMKGWPWVEWQTEIKKPDFWQRVQGKSKLDQLFSRVGRELKRYLRKEGVALAGESVPVALEEYLQRHWLALRGEARGSEVGQVGIQIGALLRGRNLYLREIQTGLKEMGVGDYEREQVMREMIPLLQAGKVEIVPAILPHESVCLRCGNTQLELSQCGICGDPAWYCPECREMGESISCRPLFRRPDRGRLSGQSDKAVKPHYAFSLSEYQEQLSGRLLEALEGSKKQDWLLWAVCGAGKTETTFGLIGRVLGQGGRVLFTSPRREVVRQMVERFKVAFPDTVLSGLYGGSEEKLTQAQLTISTVHQLVRFYRAFDLIIFDEVDAYPYKGDLRLQRLLARSRKEDGRLIYLSATPDEDLLSLAQKGKLEVLTLPARFHRKGVPVPLILAMRLPVKADARVMPEEVLEWVRESVLKELAQVFIFLPTRKMVEEFGQTLKQVFGGEEYEGWVEYTHSQDEGRSRKVEAFLRGEYPILVTSTIMERGVTVPKGNVLVLYADAEEIFDTQSLVQMAGRAGRSIEAPHGSVWFVGGRVSGAMEQARGWIERMNEEARERGLLDAEGGR